MESCIELINLAATCNAIKKVGGVTSRIWLGRKSDWNIDSSIALPAFNVRTHTSLVYDSSTSTGEELAYYEGVMFKNSASFETQSADNVNAFTHNVSLVLFALTQLQIKKLEDLILNEDLFCVLLSESGKFMVYGVEKKIYDPLAGDLDMFITDKRGLKSASGTGIETVELQGEQGVVIELQALNMLSTPFVLEQIEDEGESEIYTSITSMSVALNQLSENNA